jgi:hypothetical protein
MRLSRFGKTIVRASICALGCAVGSEYALAQPALPTSGVCGFSSAISYPFAYLYGPSPGTGYGMNWFGTINFASQVISINAVLENPGNATNTTESQSALSNAPFLASAGPISGSYIISFNVDGTPLSATPSNNQFEINVIPVNDGNTLLMQVYATTAGDQGGNIVGECDMQYSDASGNNIHLGPSALQADTSGTGNAAAGASAMFANTTGANNTAFGMSALYSNTSGKGNAAQGVNALYANTTGIRNLGIGSNALYENVTGSYNVALGFDAGYNSTGNDNVYINNQGLASDAQTMRLGTQGTSGVVGSGILKSYIAGVATTTITGAAVYITSSGQLGVLASSERFKKDIRPLEESSLDKLAALEPVSFKLRSDPSDTLQYGLIAEKVAKVYPELVIRGPDGQINGVRYEELTPMLLKEVQDQRSQLRDQSEELAALRSQLEEFKRTTAAELGRMRPKE